MEWYYQVLIYIHCAMMLWLYIVATILCFDRTKNYPMKDKIIVIFFIPLWELLYIFKRIKYGKRKGITKQ